MARGKYWWLIFPSLSCFVVSPFVAISQADRHGGVEKMALVANLLVEFSSGGNGLT
jgi:hypothetical protein